MLPIIKPFDIQTSLDRINTILDASKSILEVDSSYDIDQLDYNTIIKTKLVYVSLVLRSDNPTISDTIMFKQYKASLAELIPILSDSDSLVDIDEMELLNVIAVYSNSDSLNSIIDLVAKANSMCEVLNMQFEKNNMPRLTPGIGVAIADTHILRVTEAMSKTEELLRVSNGLGDALNYSKIANTGLVKNPIIISPHVWEKLTDNYKEFFSYKEDAGYYYASLINITLNNWIKENR